MACPTCDHTMHCINSVNEFPQFWCPRCGTLKENERVTVPTLVPRVRSLIEQTYLSTKTVELGVTECIWKPSDERREANTDGSTASEDASEGA